MIEPLEQRGYFAVSLDAAGFTAVTPASDTKVIYVSTSGSNSNSGLSSTAPVQTLAYAQSLARDGYADWVLLKRGDTFGAFGQWNKKGRSASEPLYIGAYGATTAGVDNRPIVSTGLANGFVTYDNGSRRIDNLILSSISFTPGVSVDTVHNTTSATRVTGIGLYCQGANITIEDCKVAGFNDNIVLGGNIGVTDSTLRRNQILDAHASEATSGHAQGLYASATAKRIVVEENVFDHNGWRQNTPTDRVYFSHDIYLFNGAGVTVRNNIIADAGFYGIKGNAGGTYSGNLFIRNSESVYLEMAASVEDNVITESVDMQGAGWGVGINTQKSPSATIRGNLITNSLSASATGVAGIYLFNNGTPFTGTVENNIVYKWRNAFLNSGPGNGAGSVQIRNNQITTVFGDTGALEQRSTAAQSTFVYSGNVYSSGSKTSVNKTPTSGTATYRTLAEWKSITGETDAQYKTLAYPDPGRTIARYQNEIIGGTATTDGFIAGVRGVDKANWNARLTAAAVNAWFRTGFAISTGADFNGDGVVNSADFNSLVARFGQSATATTGDATGDGTVDTRDFATLLAQFGRSTTAALPAAGTSSTSSPFATAAIGDSYLDDLLV